MHNYATLVSLAGVAGYDLKMPCNPLSTQSPVLMRGDTELVFLEIRDVAEFLKEQVSVMADLADQLG